MRAEVLILIELSARSSHSNSQDLPWQPYLLMASIRVTQEEEEEEEDRLRSISGTQIIRSDRLDRQGQVHGPKHCDTVIKYQPPYHMGLKVVSA